MKKILFFFLMDITHKPAIDMDPLPCTPIFTAIMSRNRFQLLLKFLHFNNNSNMPAPIDTLFKLWPLLNHVSACNISIDESLLLWKGRLGFKEYIPLKELDLVWNNLCCVRIYTGKENIAPRAQELSLSERVAFDLIQPKLQKGHHLCTNNRYTNLPMYKYLHSQGTLACGTIRSNRKGFPEQLKNVQLRRDKQIACHSDELLAIKLKDKMCICSVPSMTIQWSTGQTGDT